MKVAILAGGQGTRLSEQTQFKSKAMVTIGGQPILWHILKYYEHYGFREFVIALGHHANSIRDYFIGLGNRQEPSQNGSCTVVYPSAEPGWTVQLIETGLETMSGGRIKRLAPYLGDAPFMLTWCDGLADVDLNELLAFHRMHGRLATLTAIHPPARFGRIALAGDRITAFQEKTVEPSEWINGAFFVLEPEVLEYIDGDETMFEHAPLERLASAGQLMAYQHTSFWQCMDTLRDKHVLQKLWDSGAPPWKIWS
jgi:glucose-1-phosphate cytidylyltransferase